LISGIQSESEEVPAEWEDGLLKILPKSGDLSQPGNYRGIMLLEVLYKVAGNILKARLTPIQESLEHESQCGFRPNRGCSDASFSLRMAVKKRREHGMETWVLLLDLVKAFDRVPRSLLWQVLRKFGVPEKLVRLLIALHKTVNVKFDVDEVQVILQSVIGVKQGDLLGPQLFTFHICAIMMAWRLEHHKDYSLCEFGTKMDSVVRSRKLSFDTSRINLGELGHGVLRPDVARCDCIQAQYIKDMVSRLDNLTVDEALGTVVPSKRGLTAKYSNADLQYDLRQGSLSIDGVSYRGLPERQPGEMFEMSGLEYADDTALLFCDRPTVERMAPVVNAHFQRWGMDVHGKKPSDTKVNTIVLFCAAPPSEYDDPTTFDDADLSDITLPTGNVIPVVDKAKYLGTWVAS